METQTIQNQPNRSDRCDTQPRSLGAELLRLQTARELARVHIVRATPETRERWAEHDHRVDVRLAEIERRIAKEGKRAVTSAIAGVQALEREVCEFIEIRSDPPAHAHGFFAPLV
jgi:hypothetical protein